MAHQGIASTEYHPPVKHSVEIAGHKTSLSLEPLYWDMLRAAARERDIPLNSLVATIDAERLKAPAPTGLAGAVRIWLTTRLRQRIADHDPAGDDLSGGQ